MMPVPRSALLAGALLLAGCDDGRPAGGAARVPASSAAAVPDTAAPAADSARLRAVRDVVAHFGERMQAVSLLASDSTVAGQLAEVYGSLVTPQLLAAWTARPDSAPGRRVSSPWPDHIRIDAVRPVRDDLVEVTGAVVYVTSVERARGGSAATAPVRLEVSRAEGGAWRVSGYTEGASRAGGAP
jgi:hypothetical protein